MNFKNNVNARKKQSEMMKIKNPTKGRKRTAKEMEGIIKSNKERAIAYWNVKYKEGIIENQRIVKEDEEIECIRKACEIMMNSLPVCQKRKISYSTFSAIDCFEDGKAKIVEEGNPDFIWIRNVVRLTYL